MCLALCSMIGILNYKCKLIEVPKKIPKHSLYTETITRDLVVDLDD